MTKLEVEDVLALMQEWESLPGAPKTVEGQMGYAKAFLRIITDSEKAAWLSGRVLDGCEYFPVPIELRRIYTKKYPPADGQETGDCDMSDMMGSRYGRK